MNTLGWLLVWMSVQVSVFGLAGSGLYLLARRRNPAAGAWAAGTVMIAILGVSALAVSPWPRWWTVGGYAAVQASDNGLSKEQLPSSGSVAALDFAMAARRVDKPRVAAADAESESAPATPGLWSRFWSTLRGTLTPETADTADTTWRWPAWLAVIILVGCALALARLLLAIAAVGGYRSLTRAIDDPSLLRTLDEVRAMLDCRRAPELRETAALCSPSTTGWLRPMVILPGNWRHWSVDQQRAVLAHEVAHVTRGDFAVWLFAQLGVALHFYNPLVHWLAGRLRLEQELAADLFGAHVAGGRKQYLTTLAEMALGQNGPQISWAARPFLSTHKTLMTRIEMLHRQKILPNLSLSYVARAGLGLALVVAGSLVVGVRGPATAAPPEVIGIVPGNQTPISLDFVDKDTEFVLALRPSELARLQSLAPVKSALEKSGVLQPLGLALEDLEEFKMVSTKTPSIRKGQIWRLMVWRSHKPLDWSKLALVMVGKSERTTVNGHEYYQSTLGSGRAPDAYWLPDDRTIVFAPSAAIERTFALRDPANQPTWADKWKKVAGNPAVVMLGRDALQEISDQTPRSGPPKGRGDVGEHVEMALFTGNEVSGAFRVSGDIECRTDAGAQQTAERVRAWLDEVKKDVTEAGKQPGSPAAIAAGTFGQVVLPLVDATKVEVKDAVVHSETTVMPALTTIIGNFLVPARAAASRTRSQNNMKQIGIALFNYHDKHGHFPSAVVMGSDGKTPHSWRVELLPYMDRAELFNRYQMDQPWDSEENRKLIAEGAELFSVPGEMPSEDCGYFVLTGPGTPFDPDVKPSSVRTIIDGTSMTIGVVEAKRSIPWTKPEDIAYSPDKPLPKLGGHFEAGFDAAYLDGSVRTLPNDLDEATLRALISCNGREPISIDPHGRPRTGFAK